MATMRDSEGDVATVNCYKNLYRFRCEQNLAVLASAREGLTI